LGHAILCAERAVAGDPFAVLLADDFLTDYEPGVTRDLVDAFEHNGKIQLSVMEVAEHQTSKYGVVVPGATGSEILGLI
jgi:UTP--glucose-1-phosphate uridylyltransferase